MSASPLYLRSGSTIGDEGRTRICIGEERLWVG